MTEKVSRKAAKIFLINFMTLLCDFAGEYTIG